MSIANIKTEIQTLLEELITLGNLGGITVLDLKKDPFDSDIHVSEYPHAYLTPPSMSPSERFDNRTLLRTYNFTIMILVKPENISSVTEVEELMEAIMNKFDNSITLNGEAMGGILPTITEPEPIHHLKKQYITFDVTLQAKDCVPLTFTT